MEKVRTFFSEKDFWTLYNKEQYEKVKSKYDPDNVYQDLYKKVVTG